MTGKHYNWHKRWRRDGGRLVHDSGLIFTVLEGNEFTDLVAEQNSLTAFQAHEQARGLSMDDVLARLRRLTNEAQMWHQRNP